MSTHIKRGNSKEFDDNYNNIFRKKYEYKIWCFECKNFVATGESFEGREDWLYNSEWFHSTDEVTISMHNFESVMAYKCPVCDKGKLVVFSESFEHGLVYSPLYPEYIPSLEESNIFFKFFSSWTTSLK